MEIMRSCGIAPPLPALLLRSLLRVTTAPFCAKKLHNSPCFHPSTSSWGVGDDAVHGTPVATTFRGASPSLLDTHTGKLGTCKLSTVLPGSSIGSEVVTPTGFRANTTRPPLRFFDERVTRM